MARWRRKRPPRYRRPDLTVARILTWADDYHRRNGRWPRHSSGRIRPFDETWHAINMALTRGHRGLPGGSSLAKLLAAERGVRNPYCPPPLSERQIMGWARAHFRRTGEWPRASSGPISEVPGETWTAVNTALLRGTRGLPGKSSISSLLAANGIKHNRTALPRLPVAQILKWADLFFQRHGHWPLLHSGPVEGFPLESWLGIDTALRCDLRGLSGNISLARFLNRHRNLFRGKTRRPKVIRASERLTVEMIMAWGRAFRRRTGHWPNRNSGPVAEFPGMNWSAVDADLKAGCRGLPGGSSLAMVFAGKR
jgi:hypothetical protein